jgi:drug/metabolite transporter (DMT)-like permease
VFGLEGARPRLIARVRPLIVLVAVTAVWGVTFVQVKDAVALYPLFAFLAVRFAIASCALAPVGLRRLRSLGRAGLAAGAFAGALLGAGYVLQTAGLERTSVSSTGFITGMYVVLTPLLALVLFRVRAARAAWVGVLLATAGLYCSPAAFTRARWPATCSCSPGPPSTRCRSC